VATAAPAPTVRAPAVPAAEESSAPAEVEIPALLEHPVAGTVVFVVLALLGCVVAGAVAGSFVAGLALAGVVGGVTAVLVAAL